MRYLIYLICAFLLLANHSKAQVNYFEWSNAGISLKSTPESSISLNKHLYIQLEFEKVYKNINAARTDLEKISLPTPDGEFITFIIHSMDLFESKLQKKFPGFFSYYGVAESDPQLKLGLTISPWGITAFVLGSSENTYFIDPAYTDNNKEYLVYYKKNMVVPESKTFFCKKIEDSVLDYPDKNHQSGSRAGDCQLRTYRLALACTGEYGIFHGGTVEKVLNAFQIAVTRINVVYRKEIGITLKLVDGVENLIYFNPSTDPYTNSNTSAMLAQNQTTVDDIIGRANYDIGHVFGTGDGGIASLGSVCNNNRKAQGVTGRPSPVGDAFFIDYVAHEMGHQFRANHTQNNSCQRNNPTAVEPGSASTIMGYAGICSPNVQNNSNDYFHTISLSEISSFILSQPTCGTTTNLLNNRPVLTVDKSAYTIPILTPFYLDAAGKDEDNDILTYTWEQMNSEVASMPPKATNVNGPMFRSAPPSTNSIRYFPDLKNKYGQWEVLPSVTRTMNFRGTLRDNSENGGCTSEQNVTIQTNITTGPFLVTEPNVPSVVWLSGNQAEVKWEVAKTDQSPVNCQMVDIKLSFDGGLTYPVFLVRSVPNSGQALVTVPNIPTLGARVMVVAADNIFFDVSNFSFEIRSSFDIQFNTISIEACNQSAIFPFETISLNDNVEHAVAISIVDNPQNFIVQVPDTIRQLPSRDSLTVFTGNTVPGIYAIVIEITDGLYKIRDTLYVTIRSINEVISNFSPDNGRHFASAVQEVLLSWQGSLPSQYQVQVSPSVNFPDSTTITEITDSPLWSWPGSPGIYYWRVRALSNCFDSPWSSIYSFYIGDKKSYVTPLLRNNGLIVKAGEIKSLSLSHLKIEYEEKDEFTFQIIESTKNGVLLIEGPQASDTLSTGDTFNTRDIAEGNIKYTHFGGSDSLDYFVFSIENTEFWEAPLYFNIHVLQTGKFQGYLEIVEDIQCNGDTALVKIHTLNAVFPIQYRSVQDSMFSTIISDSILLLPNEHQWILKDVVGDSFMTNLVKITAPEVLVNMTLPEYYNIVIEDSGGAGFSRLYSIDQMNYQTNPVFINIEPGLYYSFVKDINGCTAKDTVLMSYEPFTVTNITGLDSLDCPDDLVIVQFNLTGGFSPYTITYQDTNFTDNTINLGAGSHMVRLSDAGGKFLDTIINLFSPDPIVLDFHQDRSEVSWEVTGGNPPYSYSFDGVQYFFDSFAQDLINGRYTIWVKDANDCILTYTFEISLLQTVSIEITAPLCFGGTGSIEITPDNGSAPILVGLSKNQLDSIYLIDSLFAGEYTLYVTDSVGDSIEQTFTIVQPDSLVVLFEIRQDTVIVIASGGNSPYMYSVDEGLNYFPFNVFYHVPPGKHDVLVKDANGCITRAGFEILSSVENTNTNTQIIVFPNPVHDWLNLDLGKNTSAGTSIYFYDVQGQKLKVPMLRVSERLQMADVSSLNSGLYIVEINNQKKIIAIKFTKI